MINWLHLYYTLFGLFFFNWEFILDYNLRSLFGYFITPIWVLNFTFNYFLFSLLFFSLIFIYHLNMWYFIMIGCYINWYDLFYLLDTNYLMLVNELLTNSLNAVHPPITYICIVYIVFYYFSVLLNYLGYTILILYTYQFYYYLVIVWSVQLFNFLISTWWALQEGTWGGWWGWDISEILMIVIIIITLILKHLRICYMWLFNGFIWLFRILECVLIFYKLFRIYFVWNLHTFFLAINVTLWSYNSYYVFIGLIVCILSLLNRGYSYFMIWIVVTRSNSLLHLYLVIYAWHLFFDLIWLQFYNMNFYFLYWCWIFLIYTSLFYSLWFHLWVLLFYICISCNYFQFSVYIYKSYNLMLYLLNELESFNFMLIMSCKLVIKLIRMGFYAELNFLDLKFNTICSQYVVLLDLHPTLLTMFFNENLNFIYILFLFLCIFGFFILL